MHDENLSLNCNAVLDASRSIAKDTIVFVSALFASSSCCKEIKQFKVFLQLNHAVTNIPLIYTSLC